MLMLGDNLPTWIVHSVVIVLVTMLAGGCTYLFIINHMLGE